MILERNASAAVSLLQKVRNRHSVRPIYFLHQMRGYSNESLMALQSFLLTDCISSQLKCSQVVFAKTYCEEVLACPISSCHPHPLLFTRVVVFFCSQSTSKTDR